MLQFKYALVRYKPNPASDNKTIPLGIFVANTDGSRAFLVCIESFALEKDNTPGKKHIIPRVDAGAVAMLGAIKRVFEHVLVRMATLNFGEFGIDAPVDTNVVDDNLEAMADRLFASLVLSHATYAAVKPLVKKHDLSKKQGRIRYRRPTPT